MHIVLIFTDTAKTSNMWELLLTISEAIHESAILLLRTKPVA